MPIIGRFDPPTPVGITPHATHEILTKKNMACFWLCYKFLFAQQPKEFFEAFFSILFLILFFDSFFRFFFLIQASFGSASLRSRTDLNHKKLKALAKTELGFVARRI